MRFGSALSDGVVARHLRARVYVGPVLGGAGLPAFAKLRRGKPALPRQSPGRSNGNSAFTLLEVLLAVALFAIAVVMLAGAYVNVLDGVESVRTDRAFEQELRWIREKVLLEPALDKVEEGGEAPTPDFGLARWEVTVEPTTVADLFLVSLHVTMEGGEDQPLREVSEQFMLLRPAWSEPLDRDKLRNESRTRIEEQRRHRNDLERGGS